MTARLATHEDVSARATELWDLLAAAGLDVEPVADSATGRAWQPDPLRAVSQGAADVALVGIRALGGSAADGLTMLAALRREDPHDVLVTLHGSPTQLRALAPGARVGVEGVRRRALLRAHRPDLVAAPLEGVPLGDRDFVSEDLDALILAAGEARRTGLGGRVGEVLDARSWLPEPGEGIVALMARYPIAEATALDHLPTRTALRAELSLLDALDAPPGSALGCLAQPSGRLVRLWAAMLSSDGRRIARSDQTGPLDEADFLGASVAKQLVRRGADLLVAGAGA